MKLSALVDKHAPLNERSIYLHPNAPWYTEELRAAKRNKQKLQKQWRKSGLVVHHDVQAGMLQGQQIPLSDQAGLLFM